MTSLQRRTYFSSLWPAACATHGWDPKDEKLRQDVTFEATGERSTSRLNQLQITQLFDYLKLQADPLNLEKAIPVANPDVAQEAHQRRRFLHVIGEQGFPDEYVAKAAKGFCNAEGKSQWRDLSPTSLEKLSWTLKTRARKRDAERRERPEFILRSEPYHLRKSTKEKQAAAREPQVVPRPGVAVSNDLLPF